MKIAALSLLSGAGIVREVTGVEPVTFPPHTMADFSCEWLVGDLIYFKLHGLEKQPFWYGDNYVTAMSVEQLRDCHLNRAVVFVTNCFGVGSVMVAALLAAGAIAVVAGPGQNYVDTEHVRGADLLGKHFITQLQMNPDPDKALRNARNAIRLQALVSAPERDALEFQLFM